MIFKKTVNLSKMWRKKEKGKKEFSSPMLKNKRDEREVHPNMTKKEKTKEKGIYFLKVEI